MKIQTVIYEKKYLTIGKMNIPIKWLLLLVLMQWTSSIKCQVEIGTAKDLKVWTLNGGRCDFRKWELLKGVAGVRNRETCTRDYSYNLTTPDYLGGEVKELEVVSLLPWCPTDEVEGGWDYCDAYEWDFAFATPYYNGGFNATLWFGLGYDQTIGSMEYARHTCQGTPYMYVADFGNNFQYTPKFNKDFTQVVAHNWQVTDQKSLDNIREALKPLVGLQRRRHHFKFWVYQDTGDRPEDQDRCVEYDYKTNTASVVDCTNKNYFVCQGPQKSY